MRCWGDIVTNEQYLYVSYFLAAGAGLCLAGVTMLILARPHFLATAGAVAGRLGAVLRRFLPIWLVLAVLLGFMSVSYFDCGHTTYEQIVADRHHLIDRTHAHASRMALYLAIALSAYGFVMVLFLWARARSIRKNITECSRS